jgi:hypothetical protein
MKVAIISAIQPCAPVAAWQTTRAANPMQLMEITENDRNCGAFKRARSARNQTLHRRSRSADSLKLRERFRLAANINL